MDGCLIECDLCGRTEVQEIVRLIIVDGIQFVVCQTCNCKPDVLELVGGLVGMYLGADPEHKDGV